MAPWARAIATLLVLAIAGCGSLGQPSAGATDRPSAESSDSTPIATARSTPSAVPSFAPGRPVSAAATIRLDTPGGALVATADALWIAGEGKAQRVDPATNKVTRTVELGSGYDGFGMILGFGSLWVASFDTGKVARLNARTGELVGEIDVGGAPESLLAAFGSVWASQHREGTVSRIDPTSNKVVAVVKVGPPGKFGPSWLAATPDKVWVAIPNTAAIVGIDVAANKGSGSYSMTGSYPCGVVYTAARLWAIACFDATPQLDVIDPDSAKLVGSIPVDELVFAPIEIANHVWVPTIAAFPPKPGPGRLLGVDPDSLQVTDVVAPEAPGGGIVAFGSLWLADASSPRLLRIDLDNF